MGARSARALCPGDFSLVVPLSDLGTEYLEDISGNFARPPASAEYLLCAGSGLDCRIQEE